MLKVDLHCHTSYSYDGWTAPSSLIRAAYRAGLDRICITDHGTVRGALEARDLAPDLVIPGIEVRCAGGLELIGIWTMSPIADGRTPYDTAREIRDQGGLVYAPHPFAYLRNAQEQASLAMSLADVVEVYNPRAFYPPWNQRARRAASQVRGVPAASSDAHFPWEVGRAYTLLEPFGTPAELVASLRTGIPVAVSRTSPFMHLMSVTLGAARWLRGRDQSGA